MAILNAVTPVLMILAYLAGLIVSIVLLIKVKGTPAILSTVAFALLFLKNIGSAILGIDAIKRLIAQTGATAGWINTGTNCCCGILSLAAIVCLIIAIYQAVSGTGAAEDVE